MKTKQPNDSENYENDELENVSENVETEDNPIKKYATYVGIAVAGIIAIVGIFYYYSYTSERNAEVSATALSRIRPYFEQGQYLKAIHGGDSVAAVRGESVPGLVEIADNYKSTTSGKLAALLAGEAFLQLTDYNNAKTYFNMATSAKSDVVKVGAYGGLGVCYEYEENYKEAIKQYERASQIAEVPSMKGRYMLYAALCYEKIGDAKKAEEIFRDLVNDRDFLEFANIAKNGLIRLGTIIE